MDSHQPSPLPDNGNPTVRAPFSQRAWGGVVRGVMMGCALYAVDSFFGTSLSLSPLYICTSLYISYQRTSKRGGLLDTFQDVVIDTAIPSFSHLFTVLAIDRLPGLVIKELQTLTAFNKFVLTSALGFALSWYLLFPASLKSAIKAWFMIFRRFDDAVIAYKTRVLLSIWRAIRDVLLRGYLQAIDVFIAARRKYYPMPNYRYKPLASRSIRLLAVQQRSSWQTPWFELVEVPLDFAPPYEAVSYTWGTDKKPHIINIGGSQLAVTPNAYAILSSTERTIKTGYLWIDSVCIDQRNDAEKVGQIAMMREVYQNASEVIVFLGNDPDAHLALRLLTEINDLKKQGLSDDQLYQHFLSKGNRSKAWHVLIGVLKLPWFHRVWVVQEVAVAQKVRILVGDTQTDWKSFISALMVFQEGGLTALLQELSTSQPKYMAHDAIKHAARMHAVQLLRNNNKLVSLAFLLVICIGMESTDKRDRLIAMLGLARDQPQLAPLLTYDRSVADLYTTAARYFLADTTDAEIDPRFIFLYAGIGRHRDVRALPSWAPDWSISRNGIPTFGEPGKVLESINYGAGTHLPPAFELGPSANESRFKGKAVDTILHVVSPSEADLPPDLGLPTLALLQHVAYLQAASLAEQHVPDPYVFTNQPRSEALWRTMLGDRTTTHRPAPADYGAHLGEWLKAQDMFRFVASGALKSRFASLRQIWSGVPDLIDPTSPTGLDNSVAVVNWSTAMVLSEQWLFCVTERGMMGLVPPLTEVGDRVVVAHGAQTPYVIRGLGAMGAGDPAAVHEFVGECFVHGLMDGEAFGGDSADAAGTWFTLR